MPKIFAQRPSKMSSLYSRYVPPKKSKVPFEAPPSPEPKATTVTATPPSTLYARYIPPKNNARTIPHRPSPPPFMNTQPEDEEPKPKKRRKVGKEVEERTKEEKKKHRSRKVDAVEESDHAANEVMVDIDAETGPGAEAEILTYPEDNDVDSGADFDSDAQDTKVKAIFAKYRHSVQIQTAINSKRAKEGVRTPTPEPELHGKSS